MSKIKLEVLRMAASKCSEANISIKKVSGSNSEFLFVGEEGYSFAIHDREQLNALIAGLQFARQNIGWD